MARMSPGREMKKFMDNPKKVGSDPEMDMKKMSSKRKINHSSSSSSNNQEMRAAKMAKMMMRKR